MRRKWDLIRLATFTQKGHLFVMKKLVESFKIRYLNMGYVYPESNKIHILN